MIIFTNLSKYIFIFLSAIFCLEGFLQNIFREKRRKAGKLPNGILQKVIVLIFVILGNTVLFVNKKDFVFILLLFMELFYFFFLLNIFPMLYKKCNQILLNDMSFFMVVGVLMLARLSTDKAIRQMIMIAIGTALLFLVPVIVKSLHRLMKLKFIFGTVGIALLLVVFLLGKTVYGANLSINIGGISLQPSEFVKITFVIFVASMLGEKLSKNRIILCTIVALIHIGILVISNDLGTAVIFFATYIVMLYDATKKKRVLFISSGAGAVLSVLAYFVVSHVRVRFDVWQNPFAYIDGKGYQMVQSLFAIGNGGLFGTALTRGLPGSIPVVTKDFIFSAIAEEFGALFCIILIFIILGTFYEIITILAESDDSFNRSLMGGFGIMYIIQCFINIGGVINMIPNTGVTLPFVSYGGSSIISLMIMIAIIQGIAWINNSKASEEMTVKRSPRMLFGGFVLAALLAGYFIYLVLTFDKNILTSPYNKRTTKQEMTVEKGIIYSADGDVLAESSYKDGSAFRVYPFGRIFSHVIGYSTGAGAGLEGNLERYLLNNHSSYDSIILSDITGKKLKGDNVYTSLNADMQMAAYKAMGSYDGAVVVMKKDGSILAMVSKPDYDPTNISQSISASDNSPLLNRAVQGLYPPGSTFKILTLLEFYRECVKDNRLDLFENYAYDCNGVYVLEDLSVYCSRHEAHGIVDTYGSMSHSCNGSFINMGLGLKLALYRATVDGFRFNDSIYFYDSMGFVVEPSTFILDENSLPWEVMQTSFGQGRTLITPLHNALMMQAIVNNGIMYVPHIVDQIVGDNGEIVYSYENSTSDKILAVSANEDECEMLRKHLEYVVSDGFPHVFGEAPYTCAGKTGTAQFGTEGNEHSLFVGFMPYENPEIIVSIVLENFTSNDKENKYGVDVAKEIFDAYYELTYVKD